MQTTSETETVPSGRYPPIMSHTIEGVDNYWRGDTLYLAFVVWDGDVNTTRKNLEGASVEWWLVSPREGTTELDTSHESVSVTMTTPLEGEFEVVIGAGATDDLTRRSYNERLRITDSEGHRSTYGASFMISDPTT